jgi:hypothetical protein
MILKLVLKNQISAYNRCVFHEAPWFFEVFGIPGTDGSFESDFLQIHGTRRFFYPENI